MRSVYDRKDVIMNVETACAVRANVEYLGKSKFFRAVHTEIATHKYNNAVR